MLRLMPEGHHRFVQVNNFNAEFGGAEANVAVSLANYGMDSYFVTKLPEHEIGDSALNSVRRFGVKTDFIVRGGDRLGIYFLEKGASQRGSLCIYDRKNSSFKVPQTIMTGTKYSRIMVPCNWCNSGAFKENSSTCN